MRASAVVVRAQAPTGRPDRRVLLVQLSVPDCMLYAMAPANKLRGASVRVDLE